MLLVAEAAERVVYLLLVMEKSAFCAGCTDMEIAGSGRKSPSRNCHHNADRVERFCSLAQPQMPRCINGEYQSAPIKQR